MDVLEKYPPALQKEIRSQFRELMRICGDEYDKRSLSLIKKSFAFLLDQADVHQELHGMHLAVFSAGLARMSVKELGMDAIGVSAALLLHCVELNQIPAREVVSGAGQRIATVIGEVVKIGHLDTANTRGQAENMRNLIHI